MELALVSQRSDKRLVWHSARVVTLPSQDDEPARKVALIAPLITGWVVVPLADESLVFVNNIDIAHAKTIQAGDRIEILNVGAYVVESAEVDPVEADALLGLASRQCEVEVRLDGKFVDHVRVEGELLIGSGENCDLVLDSEEIDAEHALLIYFEGHWHLLDLSGRRLARLGAKPERQLLMLPNDSAWLTDSLELTIRYETKDLLDRSDSHAKLTLGNAGAEADSSQDQAFEEDQQVTEQLTPPGGAGRAVVVRGDQLADQVGQRALKLTQWVQQKLASGQPEQIQSNSARPNWLSRRGRDPIAELDRFQETLGPNPRNFRVLYELAQYLKEQEIVDLARIVLKEIIRYFPREAAPFGDLALVFFEQSGDESRPRDDRLADARRGQKYVDKALNLTPADVHFKDLRRKLAATIYILENEE